MLQHVQGLVVAQDTLGLADSALLDRFLSQRDEEAFEALVRRHGRMVLSVCQRILQDSHDVEDAFQATFLVFVRKAGSITKRDLLANWLYGVANHTARAARSAASRRRAKEAQAVPRQPTTADASWHDLQPVLDQELNRLPDKYRIPIILCDLQGKSRREAAQDLRLAEGTLSSRLARGRAMLRRRLARHGPTMGSVVLAGELAQQATATILPAALVLSIVRAGMLMLAGKSAVPGVASAQAIALSEGVTRVMFLERLKLMSAILLMGGGLALGAGKIAMIQAWAHNQQKEVAVLESSVAQDSDPKLLVQQALETARTIVDAETRIDVLLRIARVQFKSGDEVSARNTRSEAKRIAESMTVARPKVRCFLVIAKAHTEAKDRQAMMDSLHEAEQIVAAMMDADEKAHALAIVVIAEGRLREFDRALRVVGNGGDAQSQINLLFAFALNGEFGNLSGEADQAAVRDGIRKALAMAKSIYSSSERSKVEVDSRSIAFATWIFADIQANAGDLDGARASANMIRESKWPEFSRTMALRSIAEAQARQGDSKGALQTARPLDASKRGDVHLAIAVAEAKAGHRDIAQMNLQEARRIWEEDDRVSGSFPESIRKELEKEGLLKRIEPLHALSSGKRHSLGMAQVQLGNLADALETARSLETEPIYQAEILSKIGKVQLEVGNNTEARKTLREAAQPVLRYKSDQKKKHLQPDSTDEKVILVIAEQQAKIGDFREAFITAACLSKKQDHDDALAYIVPAQAIAGNLTGALDTLAKICQADTQALALEDLIHVLVKANQEKRALELATRQKSLVLKARALTAFADAKLKPKAGME